MSGIAGKLVLVRLTSCEGVQDLADGIQKLISKNAEQYEPPDPYYEYTTNAKGKKQKTKVYPSFPR